MNWQQRNCRTKAAFVVQTAWPSRSRKHSTSRSLSMHRLPPCTCTAFPVPLGDPNPASRRQMLRFLALAPLLPFVPPPALADRTGKYSTKLTAKRRYLPRIITGLELLRATNPAAFAASPSVSVWPTAVAQFEERHENFVSALRLFSTSFFAEGNRIGATERALKECVDTLEVALKKVAVAAKDGDREAATLAYQTAATAANTYIVTAKLRASEPDIAPL